MEHGPDTAEHAGLDHADLFSWAAELASRTGAPRMRSNSPQQAIDLIDESDSSPRRSCTQQLGHYLFESGRGDIFLAALERALEIVPAHPPSAARAQAMAALGSGLHARGGVTTSHVRVCEQALEARA